MRVRPDRRPKVRPFGHARLWDPGRVVIRDYDETLRRPERQARAAGPTEPAWTSPPAQVQALQRSAGNAAVLRMLSARGLMREPGPGAVCSPADQAKLEELLSTTYIEEDYHPSTGIGLFDAVYAPGDGNLTITLGIAFDFVNGDPANATWVASVGGPAAAATFTPDQFNWTPDEIREWKANAISQVTAIWAGRYTFFTQKDCWSTLPPVNVGIEIVERPATGADKAHYVTTVNKWPTEPGLTESVSRPGRGRRPVDRPLPGERRRRHRRTRTRATSCATPHTRPLRRGRHATTRGRSGSRRTSPSRSHADTPGCRPSAGPSAAVHAAVPGHAHRALQLRGRPRRNMRLSEDRARAVGNEIVRAGAQKQPTVDPLGEAGAAPDARVAAGRHHRRRLRGRPDDRRPRVRAHVRARRRVPDAATAARATSAPRSRHSALAERLIPGQQPILAHHSENIMSNGEAVQPHHYVTFLEVLGKMTGTEGTWGIRPARHADGPGDFPAPSPDGTAVV